MRGFPGLQFVFYIWIYSQPKLIQVWKDDVFLLTVNTVESNLGLFGFVLNVTITVTTHSPLYISSPYAKGRTYCSLYNIF